MKIGFLDTTRANEELRLLFHIESIFNRRGLKVASYDNEGTLSFPLWSFTDDRVFKVLMNQTCRRILSFISGKKDRSVKFSELKDNFSHLNEDTIREKITCVFRLN